jgi:hypothetical protein
VDWAVDPVATLRLVEEVTTSAAGVTRAVEVISVAGVEISEAVVTPVAVATSRDTAPITKGRPGIAGAALNSSS